MKILLLNQCFRPDVVSTAQYLTDLATALTERGHSVTVVAGRRGYDNPDLRFSKRETWNSIRIIRLSTLGLGKKGRLHRALDFASFFVSCVMRLALLPRFDVVIALTSPPLISWLGAMFVRIKGGRLLFWVMDLNPDEAIAAGWLKSNSVAARVLEWFLRSSMHHSAKIVVLDRFVKQRVLDKGIWEAKISIIPPWSHDRSNDGSHDEAVRYDEQARNSFRNRHGLNGKHVVMYSGNHSPCHPLDSLLKAAASLREREDIAFCFVGGGSEQDKVRAFARVHELQNILCLPYQPLQDLSASLSAADLHVVVMGDAFAGILHPCKIYNILAVGCPFLYIGPNQSHITDLLSHTGNQSPGYVAGHGDVKAIVGIILESADKASGKRAQLRTSLAGKFSRETVMPRLIEVIESVAEVDGVMAIPDRGSSPTVREGVY
ncbi:MAG TPA: glycosyltransferase family 4 protein [Pyrinomonadaceae bacterium]